MPESQVDTAVRVLNQYGAVDIDRRAQQWRQEGYSGYDPNAQPYTSEEATRDRERYGNRENATVPVIDEELQIGKRTVQRGGVRVYSHVVDRPVEEQITLTEERVRVERRAADREISDAELSQLKDQTIEVTEMAEEPVISKRARVKEEVVVGKDRTERTETVRGNVRSTDVQVDKLAPGRGATDTANEPAYQYGYTAAGEDRHRERSWADCESNLRDDYSRRYPASKWDDVKESVRRGWDRATSNR